MCQNVSWVSQLSSRNRLWSGWHHTFLRKTFFLFFSFSFHPSINTRSPSPMLDPLRPLGHNELFPPFSIPAWQEGWKFTKKCFCARERETLRLCCGRAGPAHIKTMTTGHWGGTRGCWFSVGCQRIKMCQDWEVQSLPPSALRQELRDRSQCVEQAEITKSQEQAELKSSTPKPAWGFLMPRNRILTKKALQSGIVKRHCKIQLSEVANKLRNSVVLEPGCPLGDSPTNIALSAQFFHKCILRKKF